MAFFDPCINEFYSIQMHSGQEFTLSHKFHYLWCVVVFLLAVLFLALSDDVVPEGFWKFLWHELGFAGIVAIVLIFTIEKFTREKHQRAADDLLDQINQDLFKTIYKRYIPNSVFNEVEKCVMKSAVFRESHQLDYTIDTFPEHTDELLRSSCFKCIAQTNYKLKNLLSDQPVKHQVTVVLERPINSAWDDLCTIEEVRMNDQVLAFDQLTQATKRTDPHILFEHEIEIPSGSEVSIFTKSMLIKNKVDSEIWCSRLPSDGLTLTVSTPTKGLTVQANANHSEKLRQTLNIDVTQRWELKFGIFPFQSIIFFWKPKDANVA